MTPETNPKQEGATIPPAPEDVESVNAIVTALYDSISFGPGQPRNWDRLRSLFLPGGRLIRVFDNLPVDQQVLDVETFISKSEEFLKNSEYAVRGFVETEIWSRADQFGDIAHVLSTYESAFYTDPQVPIARGLNSIQLIKHSGRWWTVTIFWDIETPERPIPRKYL